MRLVGAWIAYLPCFVLVAIVGSPGVASCQAITRSPAEDKSQRQYLFEKTKEAMETQLSNSVWLRIDFVRRSFKLSDDQIQKAKVYGRRMVKQHADGFRGSLENSLKVQIPVAAGQSFLIDGNKFTFPEENPSDEYFARIKIIFLNDFGTCLLESFAPDNNVEYLNSTKPGILGFEDTVYWRSCFGFLSDQQIFNIRKRMKGRLKKDLVAGWAIIFSEKLKLKDDQMEPIKRWLERNLIASKYPMYVRAVTDSRVAKSVVRKLPPSFLKKSQEAIWFDLRKQTPRLKASRSRHFDSRLIDLLSLALKNNLMMTPEQELDLKSWLVKKVTSNKGDLLANLHYWMENLPDDLPVSFSEAQRRVFREYQVLMVSAKRWK